jgi:ketosteroid isomerase-like protein
VLDIPYWSTTPYQFGDNSRAVKYHFRPQKSTPSQYVADKTIPDYLRLNLINALADSDNEIYYDFCIQFQENAITMPIEDPTVNWESPFIKVATVRFLAQDFDTDEQNKFGENLSFTPWHCLPEHIPIGGMNRVREKIYECLSKFRHDQNDEPLQEPTSDEVENLNSKTEIMNQKNEQVVKNLFHCYATQNMAGVMALMSTDIQWTEPGAPDVPFGGVYKGHAGITEMLEKEGKMLKVQNFTPTTFFSNENMVIVLGYDTTLVNETQKTYYTDWTMAYTINENELISKVQTYMDTNAIAKAFIKDEIVA